MTFNAVVLVFWGVEQLSRGVLTPVKIRLLILNIRLKGQSNEIIDLQFFSPFELAWTPDQWVKIFSILVKISPSYSICITLRGVWNCAGYDTARGMILRGVNLPGVSYCRKSCDFSGSYLKGHSNKIFDLQFLSFEPGPLVNGLKYFRFWLRFRPVIQIFHKNLSGVSLSMIQSISPGCPQPILKMFAQAFKGTCHKNKYGFLFY